MSAARLLAATRHVLHVQRRQRAIARAGRGRIERDALLPTLGFAAGLALLVAIAAFVVYAAWRKVQAAGDMAAVRWGAGAAMGTVLLSTALFESKSIAFTTREVLFLPAKASVLLARLVRAVPAHLGLGGACATTVWLCLRGESQHQPLLVGTACAVASLAPLAATVGVLQQRLVAPGARSALAPAFVVALLSAYLTGPADWTQDIERIGLSWTVLALDLVLLVELVRNLTPAVRMPWRAMWLDLLLAPLALVMLVLVVPATAWRDTNWLLLAALAGVATIVLLLPFAAKSLLRAANAAEADPRAVASTRAAAFDRRNIALAPLAVAQRAHRGRSLWRATWRQHWLHHGITRRDLLRPPAMVRFLFLHGAGVTCAALLGWVGRDPPPLLLWFVVVALPPWGFARVRERPYRFGVDLRAQLRHQAAVVWWTGALPALCIVAVVATLARGWNASLVLMLALLAAGFVMRVGWRGLMRRPESASWRVGLLLSWLLMVTADMAKKRWPALRPDIDAEYLQELTARGLLSLAQEQTVLQWPIVAAVAALGLFGLVRRIALWREPALLDDWIAARERATSS